MNDYFESDRRFLADPSLSIGNDAPVALPAGISADEVHKVLTDFFVRLQMDGFRRQYFPSNPPQDPEEIKERERVLKPVMHQMQEINALMKCCTVDYPEETFDLRGVYFKLQKSLEQESCILNKAAGRKPRKSRHSRERQRERIQNGSTMS